MPPQSVQADRAGQQLQALAAGFPRLRNAGIGLVQRVHAGLDLIAADQRLGQRQLGGIAPAGAGLAPRVRQCLAQHWHRTPVHLGQQA